MGLLFSIFSLYGSNTIQIQPQEFWYPHKVYRHEMRFLNVDLNNTLQLTEAMLHMYGRLE